jgi:hypothetical protein
MRARYSIGYLDTKVTLPYSAIAQKACSFFASICIASTPLPISQNASMRAACRRAAVRRHAYPRPACRHRACPRGAGRPPAPCHRAHPRRADRPRATSRTARWQKADTHTPADLSREGRISTSRATFIHCPIPRKSASACGDSDRNRSPSSLVKPPVIRHGIRPAAFREDHIV